MRLSRWGIACVGIVGACQGARAPSPQLKRPEQPARAARDPAPAPPALDCDEIPGLDRLLEPGAVVLFGELHGTAEAPAFVGHAACRASARGRVRVGLEVPVALQPALEEFFAAGDLAAAREALLAEPFWEIHDGRSSEAMLGLLERLRALRHAGRDVGALALAGPFPGVRGRDRAMAAHLVQAARDAEDAIVLALTGNAHARTDEPGWMGWHVREAWPRTRALDLAHAGGTAWVCSDRGCGETGFGRHDFRLGPARGVEMFDQPSEAGFHGVYYVGRLTASPPARPDG